jgi:cytoskeletal protein CcmA (bactofilin family)
VNQMKFFDKKEQNSPPSGPAPKPSPNPTSSQQPVVSAPPPAPQPPQPAVIPQVLPPPLTIQPEPKVAPPAPQPAQPQRVINTTLGETLSIKGDIRAEENIAIHGAVEGTIDTTRDVFVGPEGLVRASVRGANVVIAGRVQGNVTASNKVDLTGSAQLQGNIRAPKLAIAESALFRGSIDMNPLGTGAHKQEREKAETAKK